MKFEHMPMVLIALGLVLMGLSAVWPWMVENHVWTDAQAQERARAFARMHQHAGSHAHAHNGDAARAYQVVPDPRAFKTAKQNFERIDGDLQSARSLHSVPASLMKWTGIVCLLAAVGAYFYGRAVR